jgi:hypothetical protein
MADPPGYEAKIRPVPGDRRRLIPPLVAATAIGIAAVLGSLFPPPPHAVDVAPVETPVASRVASPLASLAPVAADCGVMNAYDCSRAVDAARLAIVDVATAVDRARAWPTLICGDNFDCPPRLLAATDPLGSVALTLVDRGVVWVNVFRVSQPNRLDENREVLDALVVRWFRAPT